MTQEQEAEEAVTRGIAWLEGKLGKPWDEIRARFTSPVEVRSIFKCALSQAAGMPYGKALREYGLSPERAASLGFTVLPSAEISLWERQAYYSRMWRALQPEWERRINGTG